MKALTVLAIDDSRTMRELLRRALTDRGFEVEVAVDGLDGLEALERSEPNVVITDINMPRMDGFGFIEAVRKGEVSRRVPILALTTESAPELRQRARDAGATGWIVKPFDPEKLAGVIRRVAA
ncbi:MAG: response regulator [Pseudomonadota bacterium]